MIGIDVVHVTDSERLVAVADGIVVVVEPLYGCPAALLALDAGWREVELAAAAAGEHPIPLVSYEQQPLAGAHRCRVRATDLVASIRALHAGGVQSPLIGSPLNARPLASRIAWELSSQGMARVTFVPAPSMTLVDAAAVAVPTARDAADGLWASGMLIRVLLDELVGDAGAVGLSDMAGVAVTLAHGGESPEAWLASGMRYHRHVACGGSPDDVRVASSVDHAGVVASVRSVDGRLVATHWDGSLTA